MPLKFLTYFEEHETQQVNIDFFNYCCSGGDFSETPWLSLRGIGYNCWFFLFFFFFKQGAGFAAFGQTKPVVTPFGQVGAAGVSSNPFMVSEMQF